MELRRTDNKYEFDCFYGNGWDNWARVHKGRSSTYQVAGQKLSKAELKWLHDILAPDIPITYGQSVEEMLFNFSVM